MQENFTIDLSIHRFLCLNISLLFFYIKGPPLKTFHDLSILFIEYQLITLSNKNTGYSVILGIDYSVVFIERKTIVGCKELGVAEDFIIEI